MGRWGGPFRLSMDDDLGQAKDGQGAYKYSECCGPVHSTGGPCGGHTVLDAAQKARGLMLQTS
jgi:hypothetical protein